MSKLLGESASNEFLDEQLNHVQIKGGGTDFKIVGKFIQKNENIQYQINRTKNEHLKMPFFNKKRGSLSMKNFKIYF